MARSLNADRQNPHGRPGAHGRADRADDTESASSRNGSGSSRLSAVRAAAMAQEQLEQLLQRPCESVSGLTRQSDGWMITLEVVELERVPPTTDILGTYRVELDRHGELMSYERLTRYYRNQAGGDS